MQERFEADDIYLYQSIPEISGSAATDMIACTVMEVNREANSYHSAIWLYPADGGSAIKMTAGTAQDCMPRWSPNGQCIAFLSSAPNGSMQVFLIHMQGGERKQTTFFEKNVVDMSWSPDGSRLLVVATLAMDPVSASGPGMRVEEGGPEIVWRLPYKADGMGYLLNQQTHLFVVEIDTGDTVQLTQGPFDVTSAAWSPDGEAIVYSRSREGRCANAADIWCMDANGGNPRRLSTDVATAQFPMWTPDGSRILFTGGINEGDSQVRLWAIDWPSGHVSRLGDDNLEVVDGQSLIWHASESGDGIYLIAARHGLQEIGRVAVPGGEYQTIASGPRHMQALARTSGGRLAFVAESPCEANQLSICDADGASERQLSQLNGWWYERRQPHLEKREFEVPDGDGGWETVEGWLLRPPGPVRPGPLLIDVHGGPASYVLLAYSSRPYWNPLVARGWTVLALNWAGSTSYGREFASRLRGRWGDLDLQQNLAAADQLQREGLCDGRLAIAGKSYGGYAAAWAVATTSRFRAAVISAPITNLETHYGTSDSGYYSDPYDLTSTPFDGEHNYRLPSPAKYASNVHTPVLVVQGKEDQRCPIGQAEDFFVRVMRHGNAPAEMLLYPGGSHHFYESGPPAYRVDVAQRLINWVERWITEPLPVEEREDKQEQQESATC